MVFPCTLIIGRVSVASGTPSEFRNWVCIGPHCAILGHRRAVRRVALGDSQLSLRPPLGQQIHLALVRQGPDAALAIAHEAGQPDLFERVSAVASEAPSPSFLHSALCAMSLPVRRPADEHAPIIRQDGQYTLVINPKPVVKTIDGHQSLRSLGVPYGSLPRLVLIHIMTEAVRDQVKAHRPRARHLPNGCVGWASGRSAMGRAVRPP